MKPKYSMVIRWSDADDCFTVWVPEFGQGVKRQGDTYEDAARAGAELIRELTESCGDGNLHQPEPWNYDSSDDVATGQFLFPDNYFYRSWPKRHVAARQELVPV